MIFSGGERLTVFIYSTWEIAFAPNRRVGSKSDPQHELKDHARSGGDLALAERDPIDEMT